MLTQRLSGKSDPRYFEQMLDIIRQNPAACDEVWFTTLYGYPPLSKHREYAAFLKKYADEYRGAGIRVSLQIANTLGHGDYAQSRDCSGLVSEGSPVRHMVGANGEVAGYSFCFRDGYFRDYIIKAALCYADLQPHSIWIDDDLRLMNHKPVDIGCFCDECMAQFNNLYSVDFTREELVREINFGDRIWRRRHTEFEMEGLYGFTYDLSAAIHKTMPRARVCIQQGLYPGISDGGSGFLYDAVYAATGIIPASRPGGGAYTDHSMNDFYDKGNYIMRQMCDLPEYVAEIRPEIESLPDVMYGKSIPATCFETSYYFALGATAMSYCNMARTNEGFGWYSQMLSALGENREYWKKLSEVNGRTKPCGITAAYPKTAAAVECKEKFDYTKTENFAEFNLSMISIPIVMDRRCDIGYVLAGTNARRLSDEDIERLMSKPLLTDGATLRYFTQRGFKFGADAVEIDSSKLIENYSEHRICADFSSKTWDGRFKGKDNYALVDLDGSTEPLSYYSATVAGAANDGDVAAAIVTTCRGAKWAVFGFDAFNRIVSSDKQRHIANAAEYIGCELPAKLLTPFSAQLFIRTAQDGEMKAVSIVSWIPGPIGELKMRVNKSAGTKALYMSQYCKGLTLTVEQDGIVTLPEMPGFSVATLFF